ncbi:MAG: formyltransferase family protein [Thermodesulfobacteriaceae bacterium]|nr:formyl transferase [Caldimicrobium sp.]MCX8041558.1 formyltransferase family protein [Thermodesulfobacteriaceae bacterium]MDW8136101.1 formyltransferase family protein [Thermodesulfobacterium sp.]
MKKIGWFTTGRDEAAIELLEMVYSQIKSNFLPLEIAYVFVSKDWGETSISDELLRKAKEEMNLKVITFSALKFNPELRRENLIKWRDLYHQEILRILSEKVDFGVLAGYMWIVSDEFCEKMKLINLHPALPGGPKGSWQEVIWQLISCRSSETGVMIHQVTPDLDEGPPLSFVKFSIKTPAFLPLWEKTEKVLLKYHLKGLKEREGEKNPLFLKIREEGVKRELPLIVYTLKYIAEDKIIWGDPQLPLDLTEKIETYLKSKHFS